MKTWDAYKDHVKKVDPDAKRDIEEMENIAQSSVARIESFQTTPNLDTLLKIMQPLGLKLVVAQVNE